MTDKPKTIDIADLLMDAMEAFEKEHPGMKLPGAIGLLDWWADHCGDGEAAANADRASDSATKKTER